MRVEYKSSYKEEIVRPEYFRAHDPTTKITMEVRLGVVRWLGWDDRVEAETEIGFQFRRNLLTPKLLLEFAKAYEQRGK